jgi:AcrR family transcriptional regulator
MEDAVSTVRRARAGGRTRSKQAHQAVLAAAGDLLLELGYRQVTIEGIAERSGVAKSTIYRWWRSKGELVMEAYAGATALVVPEPDTGSLEQDLVALLANLYAAASQPSCALMLRGLMAEAQLDPDFAEAFQYWVRGRREVVAAVLRRGIQRAELPPNLDLTHAIDLVFGPFWYRLLVGHAPLDPADATAHATRLLRGLRG